MNIQVQNTADSQYLTTEISDEWTFLSQRAWGRSLIGLSYKDREMEFA